MAVKMGLGNMEIDSYQDTGFEQSINITLSATPGTVTTVTLPDKAKGFKIFCNTNIIRFAIGNASTRTVVAIATSSSSTVAATDFAIGGVALEDTWEVRLLPPKIPNSDRTLTLSSTGISSVVTLEVF